MIKFASAGEQSTPSGHPGTGCIKHFGTAVIIFVYFSLSIGLTFYQRWLVQRLQFPLFITCGHLLYKFLSAATLRGLYYCHYRKRRVTLSWSDYGRKVGPVGLAGGFDVGFSNWGLELITISLYTMTKSTSIIFILIFSLIFNLEKKSWKMIAIVLLMSSGLLLFTFKSTQFNFLGFVLVLLATFSSGLRWTLAQLLMQKSKLGLENPVDMLYHVQPWMFLMVLPFALTFEGHKVVASCVVFSSDDWRDLWQTVWTILLGANIAMFMELAEYLVVATTSSLTLSVIGIFKEVCTLVLAVEWGGDKISAVNVIGLLMCLGGIGLHLVSKAVAASQETDAEGVDDIVMLARRNGPSELRTPLLADGVFGGNVGDGSDSDSSEVLFHVLQRRDNSAYDLQDR